MSNFQNIFPIWLSCFLLATVSWGCETRVDAIHDPLYQASAHTSTITAEANNSSSGIESIRIVVTTGTMTDCSELGFPGSIIPCRTRATTITHTCDFSGSPSNATCTYSQALGNQSMVTYHAVAEPVTGSSVSTDEITYAAGFPPVAGIARPVWWQREEDMAGKIDVGFYPDQDYNGLYTEFTDDLETIALGSFFNSGQQFASDYSIFKGVFNLWAAPFGADAEGCSRSYNSLVTPIKAVTDGEAIVHKNNFRDCASISLGGSGSVYAKAGDPDWLFVHEGGHFLHGQGDEYCCDGGYGTSGGCANVFSSKSACESAAPGHNADPDECVQIGTTGAWRNDNGSLETMEDRTDNSDWQDDSGYCITQRIIACSNGNCY